ncbi:serine carboxypeptidase-like 15 isoform X3 [Capsella rubella]|uniref:serine carboxypeptidase-like 15 isoform X3 n=1 Tax=Capsella rubella TaxID=81985 RepID=UPI000CD4F116|nr:serine carboxypeptidase-like 15 isoform X3 [Capsella rubella]
MASLIFKLLFLQLVLVLIQHAYSGSIIRSLPGFEGPLPFELETGYIGVGEAEEDQMFYYFVKSESNPIEDPLLVWLTGGPGCSSFSGLVYENGPLAFKVETYNGSVPTLVSTTYSWTKVANIIYLDQPVGTGFSYSRNPLADIPSDTGSAKRVNEFLRNWLAKHPEYFSNPFYVAGNSYSGKVIPAIVQEISNGNYICCKPQINLQGYVIGNPVTYYDHDKDSRIPFAHGMGLISDELFETYRYLLSNYWANNKSVRRALKVVKGSKGKWERCDYAVHCKKDIISSIPYHMNNSIKGYRSLVISGDHDMTIPFVGTQAWISSLNYSVIDKWRPWMVLDQVAGYTKTYANKMTFATVKGGGHTLEYKPEECSIMFKRWISGQPL